ncbi:hypothetical protein ACLESD_07960 [Pyxidicoccus sp. 3LFB2]
MPLAVECAPEAQLAARPPRSTAIQRVSFGIYCILPALEGPACLCASVLEGETRFDEEDASPA